MGRGYTRVEGFNTYRVRVETFRGSGRRVRKMLVPARSEAEAERYARAHVNDHGGGVNIQTKKVADHWRERD